VINRHLMRKCGHVGDDSAMTAPPQRLAAHDDHLARWDGREQVLHSRNELLASAVGRVRPERSVGPPCVDCRNTGREMPATAKPLVPSIFDAGGGKPLFQGFALYVSVAPAARVAAYVDNQLHSGILQKPLERDAVQSPVTNGQQSRHLLIMPSH